MTGATITKRDGTSVPFAPDKIEAAMRNAFVQCARDLPPELVRTVVSRTAGIDGQLTVEDVQDTVESALIDGGYHEVAKAYILYRHEHRRLRDEKCRILQTSKLDPVSKKFDTNSLRVLASRYLVRHDNRIAESPQQLFERVATLVGMCELLYDPGVYDVAAGHSQDATAALAYLEKTEAFDGKLAVGGRYRLNRHHFRGLASLYAELAGHMRSGFRDVLAGIASGAIGREAATAISNYIGLMSSRDFLPNSPTLMNAGCSLGQLSACFVLEMPDRMEKIMKSTSDAAMIFKSGGGVGINYSDLREEGDIVASTSGVASGPMSFMEIINTITDVIKQGGRRRGANMGILDMSHPDVEGFIERKLRPGILENFNLSVGIDADYWEALYSDGHYDLVSPRTGQAARRVYARHLLELVAQSAWNSAEPGVIFWDNVNKYNVLRPARGADIRATNPCGEQSLYPHESCNLGSINLANFVTGDPPAFDWERFESVTRSCTRFLDNVIDANRYPTTEISRASRETRRIGLGVMGVADLLYALGIPYNSEEGYALQSRISETLTYVSMDESVKLAESRGAFPLYPKTEYPDGRIPVAGYHESAESHWDWDALVSRIREHGIRNVMTTTVAPTGTLAMIADCTNGMEPAFALVFEKRVSVGRFFYTNRIFEQALRDRNLYNEELLARIAERGGSIQGMHEIPESLRRVFVTAMDIHWADHLMAQSVWQRWTCNAIAKTINIPHEATVQDVKSAYVLAHHLGLKGVTVYRDGSRNEQVMYADAQERPAPEMSCYVRNVMDGLPDDVKRHMDSPGGRTPAQTAGCDAASPPAAAATDARQKKTAADDGTCPACGSDTIFSEGCHLCLDCGYSGCAS